MSIKTLRKRIALVAVSALGAGLMSVVVVPTANAAANVAAGTAQTAASTEGIMNVATSASTTGSAVTTLGLAAGVPASNASVGLVNVSDIAGTLIAGTTQTAVLLSTGAIVLYTEAETNGTGAMFEVDNGTMTVTGSNATAVNGTRTRAAMVGDGTSTDTISVAVTPNAGATSMIVKLYNKASSGAASSYILTSSPGDLVGQITVTIAATSTAGAMAASKSNAWWVDAYNNSAVTADEATAASQGDYNDELFLQARVRDIYGTAVTSTKLLSVTVTGGAKVKLNPGSATDVGTQTTDYEVTNSPDATVAIISNPGVSPMAGTVTFTWDGTVVGTRSYAFSGEVSKVTLSYLWNGKTGGSGSGSNVLKFTMADSAGNPVYTNYDGDAVNDASPLSSMLIDSSVLGTIVTAASTSDTGARGYKLTKATGIVTSGRVVYTCGSTAGTGKVAVSYTNVSGTVVKSNAVDLTCAGAPVTYKASYDKATYRPGEIATLTVQFYDAKGNKANDIDDIDTDVTGEITVSTAGMDSAINGPSTNGSDEGLLLGGAVEYTFSVGQDEGTFTNRINVPDINTAGAAYGAAAVSATLTVAKAPSGAVSNAEVLAAIVKLIASINEQIALLQKQLKKATKKK